MKATAIDDPKERHQHVLRVFEEINRLRKAKRRRENATRPKR